MVTKKRSGGRGSRASRGDARKPSKTFVKPPPLTAEQKALVQALVEGRSISGFLEGDDARKALCGEDA